MAPPLTGKSLILHLPTEALGSMKRIEEIALRISSGHLICWPLREDRLVKMRKPARAGRVDYLRVGSAGVLEPLPAAEARLGRRTARTFPLFPPPQKN